MGPQPISPAYPRLPRSWKGRYPFRLACPSFVYPADYDVNVDRLGPHVDDIELLCFESRPESQPTTVLIDRLVRLGSKHDVGFNVHLPTDLALGADDAQAVRQAARTMRSMTRRLAPLAPRFFVLHLEWPAPASTGASAQLPWQARTTRSLEMLRTEGCPLTDVLVENQTVPLEWIAPLLEFFDLDLCLDIGHLLLAGADLGQTLSRWQDRIRALHIHGVGGGRDHRALSHLPDRDQGVLADFLKSFSGSVSVEVFGFATLCESLLRLENWMADTGPSRPR